MNTRLWLATSAAIAMGMTMTAFAQYPQSSSSSQSQSNKNITITGCVERAQPAATGTTGTSNPASATTQFILTNAALSTSGMAGTSGATTPPATAIASEYRLDTTDEATLSPHVGHKVEITGSIEQPSQAEEKPPASAANAPTLKVQKVKMLASTCPS